MAFSVRECSGWPPDSNGPDHRAKYAFTFEALSALLNANKYPITDIQVDPTRQLIYFYFEADEDDENLRRPEGQECREVGPSYLRPAVRDIFHVWEPWD